MHHFGTRERSAHGVRLGYSVAPLDRFSLDEIGEHHEPMPHREWLGKIVETAVNKVQFLGSAADYLGWFLNPDWVWPHPDCVAPLACLGRGPVAL